VFENIVIFENIKLSSTSSLDNDVALLSFSSMTAIVIFFYIIILYLFLSVSSDFDILISTSCRKLSKISWYF